MEALNMTTGAGNSDNHRHAVEPQLLSSLCDETLPMDCAALQVSGLASDSRAIVAGDLFIALKGLTVNGHDFIAKAIKQGAIAVFAEADESFSIRRESGVPIVYIPDLGEKLSQIAGRFYADPSRNFTVIGITGTNGKTTCSHLIASVATSLGQTSGVIGTLGYGVYQADGSDLYETGFTTPDAVQLQACMKSLGDQQCKLVAAEVSSHALAQHRADAIDFNIAVLTNLSRDHLDFHKDMASYGNAKKRLFMFASVDTAIINADDPFGNQLAQELKLNRPVLSYSTRQTDADIYASNTVYAAGYIAAEVFTPWGSGQLKVPLIGEFNLSNVLAALSALLVSGISLPSLLSAFANVKPVNGRMEVVTLPRVAAGSETSLANKTVVVDFAHTPQALELSLSALRSHTKQKLWCVFGCGGDRDHGKRAEMGRIARELADNIVVTSDNPRNEPAEQIIDAILLGIDDMHNVFVEPDRDAAIAFAIAQADDNDLILIAGKGHEKVQIIGDLQLPFSDVDIARYYLSQASDLPAGPES